MMACSANLLRRDLGLLVLKGTEHELDDAFSLANILFDARGSMDAEAFDFSIDLFVAVTLYAVRENEKATLLDVLNQPWPWASESERHMVLRFVVGHPASKFHQRTEGWLADLAKKVGELPNNALLRLVICCREHWQRTLATAGKLSSVGAIRKKAAPRKSVQIFAPDKVEGALQQLHELSRDKRAGGESLLKYAKLNEGYRTIPDVKKASIALERAKNILENLMLPLDRLQLDLILAGAMAPGEFHVTPILLLGDPGIGKTHVATELADALGVKMEKFSAGGAQAAFQINGSHSTWTNAKYGSLISLLARGQSSSPVVVIDEVDKMASAQNIPILPALLDLLESRSAKCFRDEFFKMEFDCGRIIFVLTANTLESVPAPLLSRVNVFEVPRPAPAQRLRIIKSEIQRWQKKTRRPEIEFDVNACRELADRVDLDLIKTTDLIREGFGRAMSTKAAMAKLSIPPSRIRTIGF